MRTELPQCAGVGVQICPKESNKNQHSRMKTINLMKPMQIATYTLI